MQFPLEHALECEFCESDGECQAKVGENFGMDFAEDSELLAIHRERRGAAGDERGMVDGGVFGRPAELTLQRVF